jgi:hypothetical protein
MSRVESCEMKSIIRAACSRPMAPLQVPQYPERGLGYGELDTCQNESKGSTMPADHGRRVALRIVRDGEDQCTNDITRDNGHFTVNGMLLEGSRDNQK